MALRRPEFDDLLCMSDQLVKKIEAVASEYLEGDARLLYGKLFTLRNNQKKAVPRINFELRLLSAELDHKISNLLSADHRSRLKPVIQEALRITDFTKGPGIGRPWSVESIAVSRSGSP